MRKQSGFTLIELMVVMAIIAILATAGLSAYTGYLKKARDTKRLADIKAIESVVMASLAMNGRAQDLETIKDAIENMNNGKLLTDPLDNTAVCMNANQSLDFCGYFYGVCDNGGYVLRVKFESAANIYRYATTEEPLYSVGGSANRVNSYDLGNCDTITTVTPPTPELSGYIR